MRKPKRLVRLIYRQSNRFASYGDSTIAIMRRGGKPAKGPSFGFEPDARLPVV